VQQVKPIWGDLNAMSDLHSRKLEARDEVEISRIAIKGHEKALMTIC